MNLSRTKLPILVERFEAGQSLILACEHCGFEETLGPNDINCDGYHCEGCGKITDYKYYEGEKCKNCGKLEHYFPDALKGCCSRPCMLQAEYAAELLAKRQAPSPAGNTHHANTEEPGEVPPATPPHANIKGQGAVLSGPSDSPTGRTR